MADKKNLCAQIDIALHNRVPLSRGPGGGAGRAGGI